MKPLKAGDQNCEIPYMGIKWPAAECGTVF